MRLYKHKKGGQREESTDVRRIVRKEQERGEGGCGSWAGEAPTGPGSWVTKGVTEYETIILFVGHQKGKEKKVIRSRKSRGLRKKGGLLSGRVTPPNKNNTRARFVGREKLEDQRTQPKKSRNAPGGKVGKETRGKSGGQKGLEKWPRKISVKSNEKDEKRTAPDYPGMGRHGKGKTTLVEALLPWFVGVR